MVQKSMLPTPPFFITTTPLTSVFEWFPTHALVKCILSGKIIQPTFLFCNYL